MANTGVITYSAYSRLEPVRTFRLFTYAEYYLLIPDQNPSELTYDFRLFTYAEYYLLIPDRNRQNQRMISDYSRMQNTICLFRTGTVRTNVWFQTIHVCRILFAYSGPEPSEPTYDFRLFTYAEYYLLIPDRNRQNQRMISDYSRMQNTICLFRTGTVRTNVWFQTIHVCRILFAYSGPEPSEPTYDFRLFTYAEYYLLIPDQNTSELTYDFRLFTCAEYCHCFEALVNYLKNFLHIN